MSTSYPHWTDRAPAINERFMKLGQSKGAFLTPDEQIQFLALAICGEAGELANLVKKKWRGDPDVSDAAIRDEVADIRIYLEHFARTIGFDLDEACDRKLTEVEARLDAKEGRASEPERLIHSDPILNELAMQLLLAGRFARNRFEAGHHPRSGCSGSVAIMRIACLCRPYMGILALLRGKLIEVYRYDGLWISILLSESESPSEIASYIVSNHDSYLNS